MQLQDSCDEEESSAPVATGVLAKASVNTGQPLSEGLGSPGFNDCEFDSESNCVTVSLLMKLSLTVLPTVYYPNPYNVLLSILSISAYR